MILYVFRWLQVIVAVSPQDPISILSNIPNCTDDQYNWTFNSMGQSPCYVANALIVQTTGQNYTIEPLTFPAASYTVVVNAPSWCNTVWYSLISACAICQNMTQWPTWPGYSMACNPTYLMEYPGIIPPNTSVPSWAYLNVTETGDTFDPAAAHIVAVGSSSTTSAPFTSTSASTTLASASSTSSSSSSHSSKTDAGAIAGGAVGCVFGGALISVSLFWLYTKHRASKPGPRTSLQMSELRIMDSPPSTGLPAVNSLPSLTDTPAILSPPPLIDSPAPVQQVYQDTLQKTYDPDDDIPTSSTIPRQHRDEGPRGSLPNTEYGWGQVGQYYADTPEL